MTHFPRSCHIFQTVKCLTQENNIKNKNFKSHKKPCFMPCLPVICESKLYSMVIKFVKWFILNIYGYAYPYLTHLARCTRRFVFPSRVCAHSTLYIIHFKQAGKNTYFLKNVSHKFVHTQPDSLCRKRFCHFVLVARSHQVFELLSDRFKLTLTTRGIGFTEQNCVCFLKIITLHRLFQELLNQY